MSTPGNTAEARNLFGNYEILEEVGRGGMGVVYRAMDRSLDRIVALKLLRDDLRTQSHLVTRFQREAQAVACLDHPNIVQIFSVGAVGDAPYFAMEYLDAAPLSQILKQRRKLGYAEALAISQQLAEALTCAHDAQVIHRDIKPPNILVDTTGHAYVTDFGIAKVLTAEQQLTLDGSRLGTPQYMAPERCMSGEVNAVSDIYSLGVLLFQMISGRLPYEAPSSVELVKKILSQPPTRLGQFVPDIPKDVERLVAYLIEKKPENRPQSAVEVGEAIARVRSGKPLDDRGDFLASALADFRGAIGPAPAEPTTSAPLTESTPTTRDRITHITTQIGVRWADLPRLWRGFLFAAGLLVACASATLLSFHVMDRLDTAPVLSSGDENTSAWGGLGPVASFANETDGVVLATIHVSDFLCAETAWLGTSGEMVVQFDGRPRSPREGQRMLCRLDPQHDGAAMTLRPFPLGSPSHGMATAALLPISLPDGRYLTFDAALDPNGPGEVGTVTVHSLSSPGQKQALLRWDLGQFSGASSAQGVAVPAAGLSPDGQTLCLAPSPTPDGASYLAEWATDGPTAGGPAQRLTETRAHIACLEYSPDGRQIVFLRDLGNGMQQLWSVERGAATGNPVQLIQGKGIVMGRGAFAPNGTALAVVEGVSGHEGAIRLIDPNGGGGIEKLGPGEACAWHPSGQYLAVLAKDPLGRGQIWAVEAQAPHRRVQLTYLDPGAENYCQVSPDGRHAVAPIADSPTPKLVIVELTALDFTGS